MYSNMPLAAIHLSQKASLLKGQKKIVQAERKQMSGDKAIITISDLPNGKAEKRAHQYLPGFKRSIARPPACISSRFVPYLPTLGRPGLNYQRVE